MVQLEYSSQSTLLFTSQPPALKLTRIQPMSPVIPTIPERRSSSLTTLRTSSRRRSNTLYPRVLPEPCSGSYRQIELALVPLSALLRATLELLTKLKTTSSVSKAHWRLIGQLLTHKIVTQTASGITSRIWLAKGIPLTALLRGPRLKNALG